MKIRQILNVFRVSYTNVVLRETLYVDGKSKDLLVFHKITSLKIKIDT